MAVADKVAVALTALVLAAGLAACGDSGESGEGGEQEQEQQNGGEEQEGEDD